MNSSQSSQRIQQLKESDPTRSDNSDSWEGSSINGLLICWDDGSKMIFYYGFLISVTLRIQAECNVIVMKFTSQIVTLKGYLLNTLFMRFTHDKPSLIDVVNPRYLQTTNINKPIIIEATVQDRK